MVGSVVETLGEVRRCKGYPIDFPETRHAKDRLEDRLDHLGDHLEDHPVAPVPLQDLSSHWTSN